MVSTPAGVDRHRTSPPTSYQESQKELRNMIRFRWMMAALLVAGLAGMANAADPVAPAPLCCSDDVVCVRVPEIKKHTKRVFTDVCEPLCLPKCSLLGGLFGGKDCCDGGACGECSLWKKKTLVVRIRTCEEPSSKCVAQPAACAAACPVK